MKIFIQKSINSIFINIFSIQFTTTIFSRYFVKNFLSRKVSKKNPPKEPSHQRSNFQDPASKFPRKLRSWKLPIPAGEEKKSERIGKKFRTLWEFNWRVFLRQFLRLATVIALVNLQNNHVEASPRREAWQHVTRRAARMGCSRGGNCSKHVPLARSNFLSNARPIPPPRGERSQEGWDEAAITRFVIHARLSKNVFA